MLLNVSHNYYNRKYRQQQRRCPNLIQHWSFKLDLNWFMEYLVVTAPKMGNG